MTEGYHSLIFADALSDIPFYNATNKNPKGTEGVSYRHSFDSWHLVPTSRPSIVIPAVKTNYVEINGSNDDLDLTEALTGYPLYNMREGSQEFLVLNGYENWLTIHDSLIQYLHGRSKIMILEDDISHYYVGRWKVNEWRSDKEHSIVTLDYKLKAYKQECQSSGEDWLWDPFNFERGFIREYHHEFSESNKTNWTLNFTEFACPTTPTIKATIPSGITISVQYTDIMGQTVTKALKNGSNQLLDLLITPINRSMIFKTSGTYGDSKSEVSVDFRAGVL